VAQSLNKEKSQDRIREAEKMRDFLAGMQFDLEKAVNERTSELAASNIRLEAEVRKRIEIEQDLKNSISETNRANLAKAEFLANISHEIRTPLNAVVGYSELLVENQFNLEERDTYAKAVRKNARLLAAIIGDILDLSKIVNGATVLEKNNIEIATILSEVVELFDFEVLNKSLVLKVSVLDNVPPVIIADHVRLKQILVNLVGNAVKFTQTGSVTIIVDVFEKSNFLAFAVIDTGIGIPPNRHDMIFDPFTQVDSSTSKKYSGTGLGLTISRALAQMMGGRLILKDSKLDQGSTFLLQIPIAGVVDQVGASTLPSVTNKPLTGLKILVVDDALDNQVLLQHMLISFGASSVDLAADGDEGIRLGLTEKYDLILMDLQMPRIDGFEVTKTLRRAEVRTPIIAVTAHAMAEVKERVMVGGFSEFIAKPVLPGILVTTILGVLGKKHGHVRPPTFTENTPYIQETVSIV
jgi:signal transduction histidine kinase/CheY-like chemotaxis protein